MPRKMLRWGMDYERIFNELLDRDREEDLRTSTRRLEFPDGVTRRIEAYRVTWRWFDNLLAYEFAPDEKTLLTYVQTCVEHEGVEYSEALNRVVSYVTLDTEQQVGDITDDNVALYVAKKQAAKWAERRGGTSS